MVEETPFRWRIEYRDAMRGARHRVLVACLLPDVAADQSLRQVANVATLTGIVEVSYFHWGYGFPIGGVAATDVDAGGVVSLGGGPASTSPAASACSPQR